MSLICKSPISNPHLHSNWHFSCYWRSWFKIVLSFRWHWWQNEKTNLFSSIVLKQHFFIKQKYQSKVRVVMTLSWSCQIFLIELFNKIRKRILHIQSECGKIRTRKIANRDTFHAVTVCSITCFYAFKK